VRGEHLAAGAAEHGVIHGHQQWRPDRQEMADDQSQQDQPTASGYQRVVAKNRCARL